MRSNRSDAPRQGRPPHPATVIQPKLAFGAVPARPPHPAVLQRKVSPPHAATVVQRMNEDISDIDIIQAVTQRMATRREREKHEKKSQFTMAYAVSVRTGYCYVGYNMKELNMVGELGTGGCAENRAYYVALSYGEKLHDLVFFALNSESEFFNACEGCQSWLPRARGFLKNYKGSWTISTWWPEGSDGWQEHPLSYDERRTLYRAGDEVSQESKEYFGSVKFL